MASWPLCCRSREQGCHEEVMANRKEVEIKGIYPRQPGIRPCCEEGLDLGQGGARADMPSDRHPTAAESPKPGLKSTMETSEFIRQQAQLYSDCPSYTLGLLFTAATPNLSSGLLLVRWWRRPWRLRSVQAQPYWPNTSWIATGWSVITPLSMTTQTSSIAYTPTWAMP